MIRYRCIQPGSSRRKAMRNRTEDELLAIYDWYLGAPHHPPHRPGIIRALRAIEGCDYRSAVEMMLASDWKQEDRDAQRDSVWELVCTFACLLASDAEAEAAAEIRAQVAESNLKVQTDRANALERDLHEERIFPDERKAAQAEGGTLRAKVAEVANFGSQMNEVSRADMHEVERLRSELVARATEVQFGPHKVLAVNATSDMSEVAGALAENRPFGIAWFELADGRIKLSLRSRKGGVNVAEVAQRLGGGGHAEAAEVTLSFVDFVATMRHKQVGSIEYLAVNWDQCVKCRAWTDPEGTPEKPAWYSDIYAGTMLCPLCAPPLEEQKRIMAEMEEGEA